MPLVSSTAVRTAKEVDSFESSVASKKFFVEKPALIPWLTHPALFLQELYREGCRTALAFSDLVFDPVVRCE